MDDSIPQQITRRGKQQGLCTLTKTKGGNNENFSLL